MPNVPLPLDVSQSALMRIENNLNELAKSLTDVRERLAEVGVFLDTGADTMPVWDATGAKVGWWSFQRLGGS